MKTVYIIQYQWPIKASEPLKQCTGMFDAWNGDQKTHFYVQQQCVCKVFNGPHWDPLC